MKKDELIKANGQLQKRLESLESSDAYIREQLSGFLGSYKTRPYGSEEVEVLGWPEIYFRLGKKFMNEDIGSQVRFHSEALERIERRMREQEEKENITK